MIKEFKTAHGTVTADFENPAAVKKEEFEKVCFALDDFGWKSGSEKMKLYGDEKDSSNYCKLTWILTVETKVERNGEVIEMHDLEEAISSACSDVCTLYRNGTCKFPSSSTLAKMDCSRVKQIYNEMTDEEKE